MFKEFKAFLLRGNVVDLAVAVVIGAAFGVIVTAFVKDLVTPLIAAIGGKPDFSGIYFTVNNSKLLIGDFVNAVIAFVIIAAVIFFFVIRPMQRLMPKPSVEEAPQTRECTECLSSIPVNAKRCAYCGQPQGTI
ncbi:MAG TPA: large conductance mechanosensitive channel protein MscL [Candidatus Dormibacteraeota bacterium]|nr:large conductance mechanosensitive channel protein MscL [Candidatus Dormibacteraeota bacterium]